MVRLTATRTGQETVMRGRLLILAVVLCCGVIAVSWALARRNVNLQRQRSEVSGRVLRNGMPIHLADCRITFTNAESGVFVPATIAADGSYRVRNHPRCNLPPGTCNECGLPAGTYQVVVSFPADFLPPSRSPTEALDPEQLENELGRFIPKRFRDPKTSGLTLTLTGEDTEFNVDLTD